MRKLLVAGNWKMFGNYQTVQQLLQGIIAGSASLNAVELAVFPPFVHLSLCADLLRQTVIQFGAQNVSEYNEGAYTGEISAMMLQDLGCRYVLVGHSERRQLFHEHNDQLQKKCERVFSVGLTPVLCVGETLAEREAQSTLSVVQEQLAVVSRLKDNCPNFGEIVIAYEPVWAIGTGKTASPTDAQMVHAFIRSQLKAIDVQLAQSTRVLYGGSVKPDNATAIFAMPDIDGALVGGASLNADSFIKIAQSRATHGGDARGGLCTHNP